MNRTGFAGLTNALGEYDRLRFIIEQMLNGMATATIVEVKAVEGNQVDVLPLIDQIDGSGKGIPHSTIHGMPYFAIQGGASAVLVSPKVGDRGLAVFCHNDISAAKESKGPALPGSRRRYSWSDGIYLGGLPLLNAAPTQFITLDDAAGIAITSAVAVAINAPALTHNGVDIGATHMHSGVQTGSGDTGPPV